MNLMKSASSSSATDSMARTSSLVYGFGSVSGKSGQSSDLSSPITESSGFRLSIVVTPIRSPVTVQGM